MTTRKISTDAEISAVRMNDQGSAPATPASGYSKIYTKSDGLYWIDDAGTSTGPLIDASGAIGFDGEVIGSGNLIKNYPSIEAADGAQPIWDWGEEDANITLTEEDATGESCTGINERVLKAVTGAGGAGKYVYHRLTYAEEPLLFASTTNISAGCWVYSTDTTGVTLTVYDSSAGSLGTDSTSTQSAWTWLEVTNVTLGGGTYVDMRISEAGASNTVYIANPTLNVGRVVVPWHSRALRFVELNDNDVLVDTTPPTSFTDLDLSSQTSSLAAKMLLLGEVEDGDQQVKTRRNGSSLDDETGIMLTGAGTNRMWGQLSVLCDEGQIVEYKSNDAVATQFALHLNGFWEWA